MPLPDLRRPAIVACALAALGLSAVQPGDLGAQPEPSTDQSPIDSDDSTQVRLHLRSGGQITGVLVEQTEKGVVLRIGGITTAVNFADIDRVETLPSLLQRYIEMKAAIPERDADQHAMLVQWLISVEKYEWALAEVGRLRAYAPDHAEGARLERVITSQLDLRAKSGSEKLRPPPEVRPAEPEFPLLGDDEINLIKVYEIDLARPPRMLISRETVEALMAGHAGDPLIPATKEGRDALLRKKPAQILDLMFRLRAREFYGRVEVLDSPPAMIRFREGVHQTWLVNSCATARCHGGQEAGRLWFATRRPNTEATVYTNFLILERFKTSKGTPLIDYNQPLRSPLLQLGLPREDSIFPHPPAPGPDGRGDAFRPVFRSTDDRRFRQAMDWITAMYMPRPDYPIAYVPPVPGAADLPPHPSPVSGGEPPPP